MVALRVDCMRPPQGFRPIRAHQSCFECTQSAQQGEVIITKQAFRHRVLAVVRQHCGMANGGGVGAVFVEQGFHGLFSGSVRDALQCPDGHQAASSTPMWE